MACEILNYVKSKTGEKIDCGKVCKNEDGFCPLVFLPIFKEVSLEKKVSKSVDIPEHVISGIENV
jgi:hypothetical protein